MQIQNTDAANIIRSQAKLTLSEGYPQNLLGNVQPVMDMTPRFHRNIRHRSVQSTNTTGQTVMTAASKKDTFITGYSCNFSKDVTSTATFFRANIQTQGKTDDFIYMALLTLTAERGEFGMSFLHPIQMDENSSMPLVISSATANITVAMTVYYYETDKF